MRPICALLLVWTACGGDDPSGSSDPPGQDPDSGDAFGSDGATDGADGAETGEEDNPLGADACVSPGPKAGCVQTEEIFYLDELYSTEVTTYNAAGQAVAFWEQVVGEEPDTAASTYDDRYRGQRYTFDQGDDGSIETIVTVEWDECLYTHRHFDWGDAEAGVPADGVVDQTELSIRDDAGLVVRVEGSPDAYYADYSYNDDGNVVWRGWDRGDGGAYESEIGYDYDASGHLVGKTFDGSPGDGVVDYVEYYVNDAEGQRLSGQVDEGDDGVIDETWVNSWESGRIVRVSWDLNGDGWYDVDKYIEYDCGG